MRGLYIHIPFCNNLCPYCHFYSVVDNDGSLQEKYIFALIKEMQMLENKHHVITRGDAQLVIAGTTDRSAVRYGAHGPDLKMALDGAPDAATVLLAHQPTGARQLQGVDLQLSGHTHGGLYALMQPLVAYFNDGFVSGLYQVNAKTQLYVSRGTGLWTGMALRVMCPSEITEITLKASPFTMMKEQ